MPAIFLAYEIVLASRDFTRNVTPNHGGRIMLSALVLLKEAASSGLLTMCGGALVGLGLLVREYRYRKPSAEKRIFWYQDNWAQRWRIAGRHLEPYR
jgi:hypothetical protein